MGSHTGQLEWTMLSPTNGYLQNRETSHGAPAVVQWGEPPMLKLAKNVVIWSKNTDSKSIVVEKSELPCYVQSPGLYRRALVF